MINTNHHHPSPPSPTPSPARIAPKPFPAGSPLRTFSSPHHPPHHPLVHSQSTPVLPDRSSFASTPPFEKACRTQLGVAFAPLPVHPPQPEPRPPLGPATDLDLAAGPSSASRPPSSPPLSDSNRPLPPPALPPPSTTASSTNRRQTLANVPKEGRFLHHVEMGYLVEADSNQASPQDCPRVLSGRVRTGRRAAPRGFFFGAGDPTHNTPGSPHLLLCASVAPVGPRSVCTAACGASALGILSTWLMSSPTSSPLTGGSGAQSHASRPMK
ncbi:hypothetical protein PtA15_12A127 [Puccinia triticina]|uniref:Uncharacterized protein n=1 Tax=Puccinia triticina TaxID=208348 RepID=A0ABY7CXW0_9BASI|nr:uncharacterized protein PtA15_12A127 [Puccinia triticina]WAQ90141.1 hypothetical protein PtA15_12A127 [Puccinia triticina]